MRILATQSHIKHLTFLLGENRALSLPLYLLCQLLLSGRSLFLVLRLLLSAVPVKRLSPGPCWGRSHDPTPGGWSPRSQGYLAPIAHSSAAGKEAAKGWKRGAGRECCPQICHASVCQRDLLIHPDPPLCLRGHARHLLARSIMQTEAINETCRGTAWSAWVSEIK